MNTASRRSEPFFETDLQLLPKEPVEVGTLLCVVGTAEEETRNFIGCLVPKKKASGKRDHKLVMYEITPGVDNCSSIMKKARPPLTMIDFFNLNPKIDCMGLQTNKAHVVGYSDGQE
jgi:hypothetical protein